MDEDLEKQSRRELVAEVRRLRTVIRAHRDSTGQDLCWHHPGLWGLLPEAVEPDIAVPPWPQFMRGCVRYRESLDRQRPGAPVAEQEYGGSDEALGFAVGFWGLLAKGATFASVPGRRVTRPGRALIREHQAELDHAEGVVNAHVSAWRAGTPTPVGPALTSMLERWRALRVGDELQLAWPTGAARGRRARG